MSLCFSTDVVGSSSRQQQQHAQHHNIDKKIKKKMYFEATFIYVSSMHPVSTAAQSTDITEATQFKKTEIEAVKNNSSDRRPKIAV